MDNFDFFGQIRPKMDIWLEIYKTNVGIRISILEKHVLIFRQNKQLWLFWPKFAQKWILGLEFQKSKSGFGISTSKTPWEPIFSQNGQLSIFRPKFGRIAQLRAIFWFEYCWWCCREQGGGGWSWVEAEMSWVELGGAGGRWMELAGGGCTV